MKKLLLSPPSPMCDIKSQTKNSYSYNVVFEGSNSMLSIMNTH